MKPINQTDHWKPAKNITLPNLHSSSCWYGNSCLRVFTDNSGHNPVKVKLLAVPEDIQCISLGFLSMSLALTPWNEWDFRNYVNFIGSCLILMQRNNGPIHTQESKHKECLVCVAQERQNHPTVVHRKAAAALSTFTQGGSPYNWESLHPRKHMQGEHTLGVRRAFFRVSWQGSCCTFPQPMRGEVSLTCHPHTSRKTRARKTEESNFKWYGVGRQSWCLFLMPFCCLFTSSKPTLYFLPSFVLNQLFYRFLKKYFLLWVSQYLLSPFLPAVSLICPPSAVGFFPHL